MVFSIVTYALAALGLVGIVLVVGGGLDRVDRVPDQIETRGPFELVTHTGRHDEYYSVRYRGAPFVFEGRADSGETRTYSTVNGLITFDADGPAFVVHVGDPNNTGFFYLVREVDGTARVQYLAESRGGVSADWIDAPDGNRGTRDVALHRGRLEGGRWLLLGDDCVLDTKTLTAHPFERPQNYFFSPFKGPLGLSPDEKSFVRLASASGDTEYLVVIPFTGGESYALPIDRRRMRYELIEELDAAWVAHHFEWRAGDDGTYKLFVRDFTPLPYRGRLSLERESGYREYSLPPSSPALFDTLVAFTVRELGAVRNAESGDATAAELLVGGKAVQIAYYTDHVTVYADRGKSSRPVLEIARRFDEELKTGRHDALFLAESSEASAQ